MRDYSDHATLTVSDCVVTANKGGTLFGGIGINNELGPAAPVERGNPRDAGEAYADRPAGFPSLMVVNCIISDNSGSGVANRSAIVTIINSSISGNFVGNSHGRYYYEQPMVRWDHVFGDNDKANVVYTYQRGYEYRDSTGLAIR